MPPTNTKLAKAPAAGNLRAIHTFADVSRRLSLSRETLKESFIRTEKISLRHCRASGRVEEIKEHLRTTSFSLAARLQPGCGEDAGARMFKLHTGITMQEFLSGHPNKVFFESFNESRSR